MTRRPSYLLLIGAVLLLASCSGNGPVDVPVWSGREVPSLPVVPLARLQMLNGVYTVVTGSDRFGKLVVVQATANGMLSIYTGKNAGLFVLDGGVKDSSFVLEGYWRYTQGDETGNARCEVRADSASVAAHSLVIRGTVGENDDVPSEPVEFRYERPLRDSLFAVVAHRGGGRNSDRLPASENSLGIIRLAQRFGANGIEIDVRLTKDGVPILFHDENFSPRLVNTEYCIGPVSDYTFAAVRTFCTLKDGSTVPTLREALTTVVDQTTLSLVWLDLKSADAVPLAASLAKEFEGKAAVTGRRLTIALGLPDDAMMERYRREGLTASAHALCEISVDAVRSVNAGIWAPRWTLGPSRSTADALRAEGRRTIVWTLDQKEFITPFLTENAVDGILTNYPALVAFEYHALP